MNAKHVAVASTALILVCILIGSFFVQIYQQSNFSDTYYMLGFAPPINLQTSNASQTLLVNSTRSQILQFVNQNPGVQFRALCGALCLPLGLAEYHLGVLVRAGLVSFIRDGRYKRFFVSKRFSKKEMMLICLLRHKTAKKIVETLLSKRQLSHGKLAGEVAITSQALTWQMKTLGSTEFLLQTNDGLKIVYSLDKSFTPILQKCLTIVK